MPATLIIRSWQICLEVFSKDFQGLLLGDGKSFVLSLVGLFRSFLCEIYGLRFQAVPSLFNFFEPLWVEPVRQLPDLLCTVLPWSWPFWSHHPYPCFFQFRNGSLCYPFRPNYSLQEPGQLFGYHHEMLVKRRRYACLPNLNLFVYVSRHNANVPETLLGLSNEPRSLTSYWTSHCL